MRLSARPGDIVEVERGGVRYLARVSGKAAGVLDLEPLGDRSVPAAVKRRQVTAVWRRVRT